MPRIGEILLQRGWVDPKVLARALAQHEETGMRTCSFLIECGALSADNASRALGEQHGVAALLQKHFEHRDHSLVPLLPAATAQLYTAVPIGRSSSGDVIVAVRDPKPELKGILSRAMKEKVVLAVAPATQLTALVKQLYGDDASEFDVDMGTQPIPTTLSLELDEISPEQFQLTDLDDASVHKDHSQSALPVSGPRGAVSGVHALPPKEAFDAPTVRGNSPFDAPTVRSSLEPPTQPPRSFASPLPPRTTTGERPAPASVLPPRTTTAERVTTSALPPRATPAANPQDPPTARGSYDSETVRAALPAQPRTITPTAIAARALPHNPAAKVIDALARGTQPPDRDIKPTGTPIDDTLTALSRVATPQAVAETALRYIASRWRASVLFAIEGYEAVGVHGHGTRLQPEVVRSLSISLDGPSILRSAQRAPNKLITTLPPGGDEVHDQLERLLSVPQYPSAVAIGVGNAVDYVLVVGDPQSSDVQGAGTDLQRLATAMSAAYQRLER